MTFLSLEIFKEGNILISHDILDVEKFKLKKELLRHTLLLMDF